MNKTHSKLFIPAVLFIWAIAVSGCLKNEGNGIGYLEGKISIGPLCPVERIPPDPSCLPTAETYKAYPVSVYTPDGKHKIITLSPALDGSYIAELGQGVYQIILDNSRNIVGSSNLPEIVEIVSNDSTILNINIDTGIR